MITKAPAQSTRITPTLSASHSAQSAATNCERRLTDAMIYLLALGGFYVTYQTLYDLAVLLGGYPDDQAHVVAALADLAILAYSRKAIQEVTEGRSAWGIRLIVATLSLGTFALQIRAAWPEPVSVGFHALPPAVWIIGHEMMLRGRLRSAKRKLHQAQINQGLRPAPLPAIRLSHWLLDPFHTFPVWRRMKLWERPQDLVVRALVAEWQRTKTGKPLPAAWQHVQLTAPPATLDRLVITPLSPFKPTSHRQPPPKPLPLHLRVLTRGGQEAPADLQQRFLNALPTIPPKGERTRDHYAAYITRAEQLAGEFDIQLTGTLLSQLLDCDPGLISRTRKQMRTTPLATTS